MYTRMLVYKLRSSTQGISMAALTRETLITLMEFALHSGGEDPMQ